MIIKRRRNGRRTWLLFMALLILASAFFLVFGDDVEREHYPTGYAVYVEIYAKKYDLPSSLIYAVIHTESNFRPTAVSSAGAVGLMQLMPSTFRWLSDDMLGERLMSAALYDPATNIRYGTYYLGMLYNRYGRWTEALAAYNAGPGKVDAWLSDPSLTDESGHLVPDTIPVRETRVYVTTVERAWQAYERLYANGAQS